MENMKSEMDYKQKFSRVKKEGSEQQAKQEKRGYRDVFKEFSPFQWKHQVDYVRSLTPEEYETVLRCKAEFQSNCKRYIFYTSAACCAFTFWQRQFLPRSFFVFSLLIGVAGGVSLGTLMSGGYFVQSLDKLGKEYEISRIMKQDIFDTRPDIS